MTLQERLATLITGIGTDIKTLFSRALPPGGTTGQTLTKTANTDYAVGWTTPTATGATVNDTTPSNTTVYSSNKTDSQIAAARQSVKDEILGGAGAAYDTLQELNAKFAAEDATTDTAVTGILTALGKRVAVDSAQSFSTGEKTQGRANIDAYGLSEIGNPDTDLLALYTTAKA